MNVRNTALTVSLAALLVAAGNGTSAAQQAGTEQHAGPAYSLEGAWFGMVTVGGQPTPSLDTFTSGAQRHGVTGTFHCTIPPWQIPIAGGYLSFTASGHGNWVRIAKNTYAFTAMRSVVDQTGMPFGWAKFWGTITAVSRDEYSGTMKIQFYGPDGLPIFPQDLTGTMASKRIDVQVEQ